MGEPAAREGIRCALVGENSPQRLLQLPLRRLTELDFGLGGGLTGVAVRAATT